MSRISLVIGLTDQKASTQPELVYLGRSGEEMRQAMDASVYPRHVVVPFVQGIPKNNPRAAANAAAAKAKVHPAPKPVSSPAKPDESAKLKALTKELEATKAELAAANELLSAAAAEMRDAPKSPAVPPTA